MVRIKLTGSTYVITFRIEFEHERNKNCRQLPPLCRWFKYLIKTPQISALKLTMRNSSNKCELFYNFLLTYKSQSGQNLWILIVLNER